MERLTVDEVKDIIKQYQRMDVINNNVPVSSEYYHMLSELSDSESPKAMISLLIRALWFYTAGGRLYGLNIESIEKAELIRLIKLTEEKIEKLENVISTYDKTYLQRIKVACGEKIAYRKDAGLEQVKRLWEAGYTYMQIADQLNISRATVANRIKELKKIKK